MKVHRQTHPRQTLPATNPPRDKPSPDKPSLRQTHPTTNPPLRHILPCDKPSPRQTLPTTNPPLRQTLPCDIYKEKPSPIIFFLAYMKGNKRSVPTVIYTDYGYIISGTIYFVLQVRSQFICILYNVQCIPIIYRSCIIMKNYSIKIWVSRKTSQYLIKKSAIFFKLRNFTQRHSVERKRPSSSSSYIFIYFDIRHSQVEIFCIPIFI